MSLYSQTRTADGQTWRVEPVVFGDRDTLMTDSEGHFRTPSGVPKDCEYEVRVRVAGMAPGHTLWLKAGRAFDGRLRRSRAPPLADCRGHCA